MGINELWFFNQSFFVFKNETPNDLINLVWEDEQIESGHCLLTNVTCS